MDFEAIHRWFLLQPFIIVGMAAILMTAAYLIDWVMEWITRDPSRLARGDHNRRSIVAAGNASAGGD